MNRRTDKEIEELNKLFREIGATEDVAPMRLKEAMLLCEKEEGQQSQCPFSEECQKTIYPSEAYAEKVANGRRKKGGGRLRSYRCDACHGFHLTSYIPKK